MKALIIVTVLAMATSAIAVPLSRQAKAQALLAAMQDNPEMEEWLGDAVVKYGPSVLKTGLALGGALLWDEKLDREVATVQKKTEAKIMGKKTKLLMELYPYMKLIYQHHNKKDEKPENIGTLELSNFLINDKNPKDRWWIKILKKSVENHPEDEWWRKIMRESSVECRRTFNEMNEVYTREQKQCEIDNLLIKLRLFGNFA